jgi:hypothetical protein
MTVNQGGGHRRADSRDLRQGLSHLLDPALLQGRNVANSLRGLFFVVYYESIKRELKIKPIYGDWLRDSHGNQEGKKKIDWCAFAIDAINPGVLDRLHCNN